MQQGENLNTQLPHGRDLDSGQVAEAEVKKAWSTCSVNARVEDVYTKDQTKKIEREQA